MTEDRTRPAGDAIEAERASELQIPDLDARFRLKVSTMLQTYIPMSYTEFVRNIDVASLRSHDIVTVVTYAEFTTADLPLAVGAPLLTRMRIRHAELSGHPVGAPGARIGFDARIAFSSPPGTGDVRRYRELTGAEPQPCGAGRVVQTMTRPRARPAERLVADPPPETSHLRLHSLDDPPPRFGQLTAVPEGFAAGQDPPERPGVFSLRDTDINQYVYTGIYFDLIEEHAAALICAAGLDAGLHRTERVSAMFLRPFAAGDRYVLRGTLHRSGDRTVAIVGIHAVTGGEVSERPSVAGRAEGRGL